MAKVSSVDMMIAKPAFAESKGPDDANITAAAAAASSGSDSEHNRLSGGINNNGSSSNSQNCVKMKKELGLLDGVAIIVGKLLICFNCRPTSSGGDHIHKCHLFQAS